MAARFDGSSVFLASFLEALKMMAESWAYLFSNWNTAAGKSARKRIELKNGGSA
jgi:DNA gyrase inhibitor GyrI